MSYPEFREELFQALQRIVPQEVTIQIVQTEKMNGCVRFGISFDREDLAYAPTIYLEPFYRNFQRGESLEKLAYELFECYREECGGVPECINRLQSYKSARADIFCRLIHIEENQNLLKDTPHITFLDFAIVAYFEVNGDEIYKGSVLIKDCYLEIWKITAEELIRNALDRTREQKGMLFMPMSEVLSRYIDERDGDIYDHAQKCMFVLTNTEKYLGAVQIYYPEVLSQIAEQLKDDFYLLPSSVHEWIIVPAAITAEEDMLLNMVRDINRLGVLAEEVLSNNIYFYSVSAKGQKLRCISGVAV